MFLFINSFKIDKKMIASIPEELQLSSSGFSNNVKKVMSAAFGKLPNEAQLRERELFYLRGMNHFNEWLEVTNEKTIRIMEFISRVIKQVIKFPQYEPDVLKHNNLVFYENKFSLEEKENVKGKQI
jgi:hypothetical protein